VAEKYLKDDEKALAALDRCYKQVDIEAKLTGLYQKKQENEHDKRMHHEILVFSLILLAKLDGRELTREGAIIELEAESQKLALVQVEALRLAEQWLSENAGQNYKM
jgi:hypothetical protein